MKFQRSEQVDSSLVQPPSPHLEKISPRNLRVVCDTMLTGLGRSLRSCGVDSVILEDRQDHMECVRIAQDENRSILTRGFAFRKVKPRKVR